MMRRAFNAQVVCIAGICLVLVGCSADVTVTAEPTSPIATATQPDTQAPADDKPGFGAINGVTTTVIAGSGRDQAAQDLMLSRIESASIVNESIDHVATVQGPTPIHLFHHLQGETFCYLSMGDGFGGSGCSSNDQMSFDRPFLRNTAERRGSFHVWASNGPADAEFLIVVTGDGSEFVSNVINGTGYVVVGEGLTPIDAHFVTADGSILWTEEVRT